MFLSLFFLIPKERVNQRQKWSEDGIWDAQRGIGSQGVETRFRTSFTGAVTLWGLSAFRIEEDITI